ncbi:hypothetical protein [Terasakiella sp. SH-1]|uniref:hypothetical protein n=1 Tax=Terasakiella sp. SH-1 TaxID=2560057 RepID=UPI0010748493|nr:hypothetical protein [Terasakiella sp. SH-1]
MVVGEPKISEWVWELQACRSQGYGKKQQGNESGVASLEESKHYSELSREVLSNSQADLSLKPPKDWTEAELKDAMKAREKAPVQERQDMMLREREWFEHYYGNEPIRFDETGKMVQPSPVRRAPESPLPVRTVDGQPLEEAIEDVLGRLPETGDEVRISPIEGGVVLPFPQKPPQDGQPGIHPVPVPAPGKGAPPRLPLPGPDNDLIGIMPVKGEGGLSFPQKPPQDGQPGIQPVPVPAPGKDAPPTLPLPGPGNDLIGIMPVKGEDEIVKGIQSGLNFLSNKDNQSPLPKALKQPKLKEDGVLGPKTSLGLKKALVDKGTGKVSEALALGQFKETVKKAKKGGMHNLAGELGVTFEPLLPQKKSPKPGFQPEGLALQDTLNDLGANLKDDGIVGPKTTDAFMQVVKAKDEDEIVNQFAHNLGFGF